MNLTIKNKNFLVAIAIATLLSLNTLVADSKGTNKKIVPTQSYGTMHSANTPRQAAHRTFNTEGASLLENEHLARNSTRWSRAKKRVTCGGLVSLTALTPLGIILLPLSSQSTRDLFYGDVYKDSKGQQPHYSQALTATKLVGILGAQSAAAFSSMLGLARLADKHCNR